MSGRHHFLECGRKIMKTDLEGATLFKSLYLHVPATFRKMVINDFSPLFHLKGPHCICGNSAKERL